MISWIKRFICLALIALTGDQYSHAQVIVKFNVTANGRSLVLNDSSYVNAFNESYQVSRLKYYVSNIALFSTARSAYEKKVFLLDAGQTDSVILSQAPGTFQSIAFAVGVDSALNCSGAQDGALDPLNGMFWTWNSGYIFFKLEGYSPASVADLKRIEHHVGGYRYPNRASRLISLNFPQSLIIKEESRHIININIDLDKYWKGVNDIKIGNQALLMTPGGLALKAADNFPGMFSITSIE